ncbi:uncharacterized protein B0J16DRAFT_341025 [Fusarium flagelliforme]|uniref:uncharacterized protein n=1 Tax=Fusarium flagelliforme TaxID=2675880 RepID=UPI001E8EF28B|nr:uncharacterized protein B0J16DRAFT_341025 [Fusarium flagelliforme]KAH7185199.1 hypothetical protein B0J16DRAFT_341025 [Fusarium flagelliforme]
MLTDELQSFGASTGNRCEKEGTLTHTQKDEDGNGDGFGKIYICVAMYGETVQTYDIECGTPKNHLSVRIALIAIISSRC